LHHFQAPGNRRRNDPLAIGIEELERSFWLPARSHLPAHSLNKKNN